MPAAHRTSAVRGFLALLSLSLALGLLPDAAPAAAPCWKTLLDDWSDGRIEATYPKACYRSAIRHLPADAILYSNAKSEITAAMRRRALMSSPATSRTRAHGAASASKRTLASVGPSSPASPPIALIGIAAAALLVLACALWQGLRLRAVRRAQR